MRIYIKKLLSRVVKTISSISPYSFKGEGFFGYEGLKGSYRLPVNYYLLSSHVQRELLVEYNIKEVKIFKLSNVLVTAEGIVFKNLKIFLPSLADIMLTSWLGYTFLLRQITNGRKSFINFEHTIIIAHDQWSHNYYHWMIDLLPRLMLLDDDSKQLTLIVPEYESEYMTATLEAIGYKQFFKLHNNSILKAKTILLPERTAVGAFQNPYLLQKLRLELLKTFSPNDTAYTRRIYVSRAKSQKRRLINEQVILPILEKYGFEYVYFEDLTFLQQIEMMRQTKVLVGVHGANLVNILFMHKGASVVEMINSDFLNLVYYRMAAALELEYYIVPCTESRDSIAKYSGPNDRDLEVNPVFLEDTLSNILFS